MVKFFRGPMILAMVIAMTMPACSPLRDGPRPSLTEVKASSGGGAGEVVFPKLANELVEDMHCQIFKRTGCPSSRKCLNLYKVVITVPVRADRLNETSPMGRLLAEELANSFTGRGYAVQEIRQGRDIRTQKDQGEFVLTRRVREMARPVAEAHILVSGTYTLTGDGGVRFNVRALDPTNGTVLGSASRAIFLANPNLAYDGGVDGRGDVIIPSVSTMGIVSGSGPLPDYRPGYQRVPDYLTP